MKPYNEACGDRLSGLHRAIHAVAQQVVLVVAVAMCGAVAAPAAVLTKTCLIGTAPEVAGDANQIRVVRTLVDAACHCASFDGSKGKTHAAYTKCAGDVIKAQAALGNLRVQCKPTVKAYYTNASCGTNPALHERPCIKTTTKTGAITCGIVATTKSDGTTPNDKCVDGRNSTAVGCPVLTHCIDAADSNKDLRITKDDSGVCTAGCSSDSDCATSHCVDGVCCDSACTGGCRACSAAFTGVSDGICAPAPAGTDPHNDCPDDGVATCGRTGVCDGANACQLYAASSTCLAASCSGLTYNSADSCNGTGLCVDSGSSNCDDGNVCTTDTCSSISGCHHSNNAASCSDGNACTVNDVCGGGTCLPGTQLYTNLRAAITEEIDSGPDAQDRIHLIVEITTVTNLPFQLTVTQLDFPSGFVQESLSSSCTAEATDYRCHHTAQLLATSACSDDGNYHMFLSYSCSPDVSGCNLCSGSEKIDFSLQNSNFCSATVVSSCGSGTLEAGEECDTPNLNGQTCQSLGYFGGTLACTGACTFDTSGCRRSRAFITSTTFNGNLGGLAGGDSTCQTRATAAGLGGHWTAWLSTSTVDAKDRIPGVEYRLVNNTTVVATDEVDLTDGTIGANINLNESGVVTGPNVWTGTSNDGTKRANTCTDWTSTGSLGDYGENDFPNPSGVWSYRNAAVGCGNSTLHLYCFEQLPYKRVFVTSTTSNGNLGGLSGADASCQARAVAAHLGGTWKAWLSTDSTNAKTRIPDAEYRLVDRSTIVANNKADLLDGTLDANISQDEFGATRTPEIWTGTSSDGSNLPGHTCNNWTDATPTFNGIDGKNDSPVSSAGVWTSAGTQVNCDQAYLHFYCFEQ